MQVTDIDTTFPGDSKSNPAILITDDDAEGRSSLWQALNHRFGADYQVLAAASVEEGLDTLDRLARVGVDVALIACSLRMSGVEGTDFLERGRDLHPRALRALILNIDASENRQP